MLHYEPVKVSIDVSGLAEDIIHVVVRHHGVPESIVMDQGLLFISKFLSLLCYFLRIKKKLSTAFHPQTDSQIKWQNSTIEAYHIIFVYWEQDDWARLLAVAEFAYYNTKNPSTSHILFELNCDYYPRVYFKENVYPQWRSRYANKLAKRL